MGEAGIVQLLTKSCEQADVYVVGVEEAIALSTVITGAGVGILTTLTTGVGVTRVAVAGTLIEIGINAGKLDSA
ncbi:hypothetical protein [Nostoc sp.]|uniref:hypothetical protein n=1 Tax=Nostoc sp. TaxID=1180 RepID=UPI0035947BB9